MHAELPSEHEVDRARGALTAVEVQIAQFDAATRESSASSTPSCTRRAVRLASLVPLALTVVEADPFATGDLHDGDLVTSSFAIPGTCWATDTDSWLRLRAVAEELVRLAAVTGRAKASLDASRGGA
jgi:hypothetical protein